jgi:hypothetical protein
MSVEYQQHSMAQGFKGFELGLDNLLNQLKFDLSR